MIWVLVRLDEEGRHADRHCRSREDGNELTLTAGALALGSRLLHGVSGIEDDRKARLMGSERMSLTRVL